MSGGGAVLLLLGRVCACLAVVYAVVIACLWIFQDRIVFPAPSVRFSAPPAGFSREDLPVTGKLSLRFLARPPRAGYPSILAFHGNGDVADWLAARLRPFADDGFGLVIAEYPGYGGNDGKPGEKALVHAAQAYAAWARDHYGGERPFLYGESLGAGVAVQLAARQDVAGLILDSPFTSIGDIVEEKFWFVPRFFLKTQFDSLTLAPWIKAPVLVLSGLSDRVVPPKQAERLYGAFPCRAGFLSAPGIGHLVLANDADGRASAAIMTFLKFSRSCQISAHSATD